MCRLVLALAAGLFLACSARAEEIRVDAMTSPAQWALTGARVSYSLGKTAAEAVREPARPGTAGSLRFTYDFDRRWWVGLQWRGEAIPGRLEGLSFWVYGDASKHALSARLEDAAGRTYEARLGAVDWEGWRQVSVPADPAMWTAARRYAEEPAPVRIWNRALTLEEMGK